MHITYDPVAEDFLLIDQGRVIERVYLHADMGFGEEKALALLARLRRPARPSDPSRKPIDAKPGVPLYEESQVKRYKPNGLPLLTLEDLELDIEL